MTSFEWFQAAQFVVMTAAALLLWAVLHAFKGGQHAADVLARLKAVEDRMNRAGIEMSDFATELQGFPERMRREFMPRETAQLLVEESRHDRERIRVELEQLKTDLRRVGLRRDMDAT